jgi:osmotically-inducible protein OsmY
MKTNEQLQRDVIEALKWEPVLGMSLSATDIGVAVRGGVVTLTGSVNSYPKKLAAERAAKKVAGVKGVAEEIEVSLDGTNKRNDTEIAQAAVNALRWCSTVPDDKVKVSVENGWLKLEGEVEWDYQKTEARREVEDLTGVKGVTNLISLKPQAKPAEIKDKIRRAFERSATVDSGNIAIDVNGSIVTLRGPVRSWAEREDAETAAWAAPGVSQVRDELRVAELEEVY